MPGPILQCLSVSSIAFEPATGPHGVHGYRLTLNMQQAWERCERILHDVQRRLILRAGVSYLDMTVPPTPFSFRYTRGWATIPELRRQLTMSLAAFVGRLALISYFLLKEESRGISTWDKLSAGADPVPLAVTNALRLTWLGDWSVHRVGAFVDIGRSISPSSSSSSSASSSSSLDDIPSIPLNKTTTTATVSSKRGTFTWFPLRPDCQVHIEVIDGLTIGTLSGGVLLSRKLMNGYPRQVRT